MPQYSITANSERAVAIPDPLIMLGPGFNVFSVFTDDIEEVKALLDAEGVQVLQVNELSAPPPPEDMR